VDSLGDLPSWQCRYPLLAVIGERSAGRVANAGRSSKADGERHRFGVIAERPTGAGLKLGMGLRGIAAKPDGRCGEGGRLWSVAEPACPDGTASHLIGPTGFREDEKKAAQGLTPPPPTHLPLPVFRNKWELLGKLTL